MFVLRVVEVLERIGEGWQVAARNVVEAVLADTGDVYRAHPVAELFTRFGDAREHFAAVGFAASSLGQAELLEPVDAVRDDAGLGPELSGQVALSDRASHIE